MEYSFLINELYSYLGINGVCEKDVVHINHENGVQLNIILSETNYIKLIMSKGFENEY